mgnify:CR=1 FL=1
MRTFKIFDEGKEIYNSSCSVNTVIFKGLIFGEFQKINDKIIKFTLQLSNGKDPSTNQWRKPTFVKCSAFDSMSKEILKEYKTGDEIWLIAKYYRNKKDDKIYHEFCVRDVIDSRVEKSENKKETASKSNFLDDDLPF